jgi:translation initiation factor IF-2
MTDTDPSGAILAPAADSSAPAASAETPAGNFGSTRGSGLARGKRPSSAAAPTATPATSAYKPTAVEIITPEREYKNPFASPAPADAPASEPAKVETPEAPAAAELEAQAQAEDPMFTPEPEAQVPADAPMFAPEPVAQKPEIQILPAAEAVRPAVSWESPPSSASGTEFKSGHPDRPRRDDRPTFRADRREDSALPPADGRGGNRFDGREPRRDSFQRDARQPRDPREARQPRDPRDARQPRDPRDARQPRDPRDEQPVQVQDRRADFVTPVAKPASGGFLGWLKGLFGGKKPDEVPVGRENPGEHEARGGERHRRRRRGGRGHGGKPQRFAGGRSNQDGGPRPEGFQGGDRENRGGDRHGGHGRRRNRGGRGRDRGGEPRSEGHQGGGAI